MSKFKAFEHKPLTRRGFLTGATAGGVGALTAHRAIAQEFVSLGSLDDLPDNWWELSDFGGSGPAEPPVTTPTPTPNPTPTPTPTPTPIPEPSEMVRRNIYALGANGPEIDALRRGVQVMKSRGDNDPTSWNYQARIHGFNRRTTTPPQGAPWGTCRHGSVDFLSWHRMYLYYFERILREASGSPSLTLPYWDYSVPGQDALPAPFRFPTFNNALYEPQRNASINGGATMPPWVTSSFGAMQTVRFERPFFTSTLEQTPHNVVHVEIGGKMGNPATAGEDPIFWLHHAQVDRLWNRWLALGGGRRNPTENRAFMDTRYRFVDERGSFVNLSGGDVLDSAAQLDYRYDDDPTPPVGIDPNAAFFVANTTTPPAPPTAAMAAMMTMEVDAEDRSQALVFERPEEPDVQALDATEVSLAEAGAVRLGGARRKLSIRSNAPVASQSAQFVRPVEGGDQAFAAAVQEAAPPELAFETNTAAQGASPVVLQLEGIDFETPPGIYYFIYVNMPDGTTPDPRGPYFAGIFTPFAQFMTNEPTSFDITSLINRQIAAGLFDGGEIDVEFVPSGDADNIPEINIDRVRIIRP